jgi:hypothetical protein
MNIKNTSLLILLIGIYATTNTDNDNLAEVCLKMQSPIQKEISQKVIQKELQLLLELQQKIKQQHSTTLKLALLQGLANERKIQSLDELQQKIEILQAINHNLEYLNTHDAADDDVVANNLLLHTLPIVNDIIFQKYTSK